MKTARSDVGSKRKGAGSEAALPRGCFDYFEFYFHGNISGSSKLLPDKIEKEGGAVVKIKRLRHAVLDAACPQAHVQGQGAGLGNNGRGCVRVVVIYPEDGAVGLLDNPDYSESRRRAADAISKTLGLQAGGLICPNCHACHLLACGWSPAEGVRFVLSSLQLQCAQTHMLVPLQCSHDLDAKSGAGLAGSSTDGEKSEAMRSGYRGILRKGNEGEAIIICDSDSEDRGLKTGGESAMHFWGGEVVGETVPNCQKVDGARTVILKHVECPGNEKFVRHLDLLSFLIQLNACKNNKQDRDTAKTKAWAFKQASNVLRRLPGEIDIQGDSRDRDIYVGGRYEKKLHCIADSTIIEILQVQHGGTSRRLEDLKGSNHHYLRVKELMLIQGVGLKTAHTLYANHGIDSWQALRDRLLSDPTAERIVTDGKSLSINNHTATRVCLQHFESLHELRPSGPPGGGGAGWSLRRISRVQIEEVRRMVHACALRIDRSKILRTEAAGSFRRGMVHSGDIDLIIQGQNGDISRGLVEEVAKALKNQNRLIHLQLPSDKQWRQLPSATTDAQSGVYFAERYMGLVRLGGGGGGGEGGLEKGDGGWRRLDITLYEKRCFIYGLFQWTGCTQLNREMRRKALRMGMVVNEFGLFHNKGTANNKSVPGEPVPGCFDIVDERGIFDMLKMKYLQVHERNAGSRSGGGGKGGEEGVGEEAPSDSDEDLGCCMDD